MPPYAEGRVYVVLNTVNDKKYVGSTVCALSKRMGEHRTAATSANGRPLYVAMRELGVDKFYIELVKDFPCERKEQLNAEEGRVIRELNTVWPNGYNKNIAGRARKEHYNDNKEAIINQARIYCEANKEAVKAYKKAYYVAHEEELKAKMRARHAAKDEESKLRERERLREYRVANKDVINARNRAHHAANSAATNERARERYAAKRHAAAQPAPEPEHAPEPVAN